jgi:glycosyltransferase involved in cell wall biosynthesis
MRIGIYAPNVDENEPSGVERYIIELVDALIRIESDHEFVLISDAKVWPEWPRVKRVPLKTMGKASRLYHDHIRIRGIVEEEGIDLLHSPKSTVASGLSCPSVMTIHDVIFLRYKKAYSSLWKWYWTRTVARSVERATRILCVSEQTARDVEELLPASRGKVRSIRSGVNLESFSSFSKERGDVIRKELGVEPPYFFFVGNITVRKNIPHLLDAYEKIREEFAGSLILAGGISYGAEDVLKRVTGKNAPKDIRFLGRISDEQLSALYQGAISLVYPSQYEGFGLQVLEAMASRCPVIASRGGALPEVVGNAGLLIDLSSPGELPEAMLRLYRDPSFRADLIRKGNERLGAFRWEDTARKTMDLYEEAAGSK